MESLGAIQELSKTTVSILMQSYELYRSPKCYIYIYIYTFIIYSCLRLLQQILTSRMIELETKMEILELVLKNIVSQSMNMPISN